MKLIRAASSILVSLLILCSCAKVGDPLPPITKMPYRVENPRLIQSGNELLFVFSEPTVDVDRVELFRQCEASPEMELIQTKTFSEIPSLQPTNEKILTTRFSNRDKGCRFSIRMIDLANRKSEFSAWLRTREIDPAPAPANLTYEVNQDRIVIRWEPPTSSRVPREGYLVNYQYKVEGNEFIQREVEFGKPVQFWVQSIERFSSPMILSAKSDLLSFTPIDTFPPEAPVNLRAVPLEESIQLIWDASSSSDLSGYRIYRGTNPDDLSNIADFVEINRFLDDSLPVGTMFYYEVTALDKAGNESQRSELVAVTFDR